MDVKECARRFKKHYKLVFKSCSTIVRHKEEMETKLTGEEVYEQKQDTFFSTKDDRSICFYNSHAGIYSNKTSNAKFFLNVGRKNARNNNCFNEASAIWDQFMNMKIINKCEYKDIITNSFEGFQRNAHSFLHLLSLSFRCFLSRTLIYLLAV